MEKLIKMYDSYLNEIKKHKIIIIANVRNRTNNFKNFSLDMANPIEFFSDEEFEEIYNAIRELDLFTKVYFNELDFFDDILNQTYNIKELLIINFARNGCAEGKKSLVPSFCDLLKIKYTSADAFVQSLCRNKYIWGSVLENEKLPVAGNVLLRYNTDNISQLSDNQKYILKPISESSSIGITKAMSKQEIAEFFRSHCGSYIAQRFLVGQEYEVPFFKIRGKYNMYGPYKITYNGNVLNEELSCENNYFYSSSDLGQSKNITILNIAEKAATILNMQKYGRIDFKLDDDGKPFIIDIATLPYLTVNSSFSFLAQNKNLPYNSIFKILILIAYLS